MQRVYFLSIFLTSISLLAGTFSNPSKVELSEVIVKKLKKFHDSSREVDISKLKQKRRCFFAKIDTNSHTSFFSFELDGNTKKLSIAQEERNPVSWHYFDIPDHVTLIMLGETIHENSGK